MKVDKTKWKYTRLDNLVHILNGFAFKSDCYCQKGIRVIRITNVQDGYIEDTDPKFYPVSYSNELSKYILHENDLLISLTGNVGRVAFLPQEMLPAAINQRFACIRSQNSTTISLEFLYFFMMNKTFKDDCIKSSKGVAQLNMSTEWLKSYIIPIPPHIEQQAIAAELNAIQTMIDGYKAQIADLDALAQSIFLDMFGNVSMNDKSWNIIPMGKLGDFKNGLNYNKGEQGKSIKIIGVGDFQNIKSLSSFNDNSSIEVEHISEEYLLHNEDIVFVRSNGNKNLVGRCLEVYPNDAEVTFSGFCIRFRKSVEISNKYLIALLTDSGFKKTHLLKSNGIGIQNINQKLLSSLPIPVPSADLQQLFALKVETIEQQKEQLRLQLQDAETLMAERMQYYFS